jgi:hypothetical protein
MKGGMLETKYKTWKSNSPTASSRSKEKKKKKMF